MVALRAKQAASEEVRRELRAVGERIETLRLLNEQLYAAGAGGEASVVPMVAPGHRRTELKANEMT